MDQDEPEAAAGADTPRIIETMAVGYVTVDAARRITYANGAAERILSLAVKDMVGHDVWERFPGAQELEFGRAYQAAVTSREPVTFDAWYGELGVWLELRLMPTPEGLACYFLDITAHKAAEAQAAQAAERARFVADVADSLAASLDVFSNVVRLAQLVVPYLGAWSIVTIADGAGVMRDTSSWHAEATRRREVARFMQARAKHPRSSLDDEAMTSRRPAALFVDAHAVLCSQLPQGEARRLLDKLAPATALVTPLVARGRTVGLLSIFGDSALESGQLEVARDIASRAALSIDNSLAYERARVAQVEAESARADAEAANKRLALLARVSEALATGADPDVTVGRVAQLVVPELADWCLLSVRDDEHGLRDMGFAHRDPEREGEVAAYAARRSSTMSESAPLARVLRTGVPVILGELSEEVLVEAQPESSMAGLVRGLDAHGVAYIPLSARGRVFGALTLVTTHARGPHTADEVATAIEIAQRAGPVLDAARAAHRARQLAESIQRSVLAVAPAAAGLTIRTRYRPAQLDNEVGGDWYDHFGLPDGSTVVTIGDVMGHDIAAIAAMAQLRTFMRARSWTGAHSPAEVLADTDSASRQLGPGTFATAITGELDRVTVDGATFRWSNAGHLPPAVLGPDGHVRLLSADSADVALGVVPHAARRDHVAMLETGAVLLLYTDGLVERPDLDLDSGLAQLCAALSSARSFAGGRDLDGLLDAVLAEMDVDGPSHDDVAMLAVHVGGPPATDGVAATDGLAAASGRLDDLGQPGFERRHARDAVTLALPDDATSAAIAREELARSLGHLPSDLRDDAVLLVSELVSNALRHGEAPITMRIEPWSVGVRVSVSDCSPGYPVLASSFPSTDRPSGRGLLIIDAIATTWGVRPEPVGKSVWFSLQVG